ncbi:MAG: SDR family NAD(P)-dependent oxidoreductase [Candidatus Saccharimonadales bacterium]
MKDQTVIITGSSDGIGAVAARVLKGRGANVVIVGRSPEKTKRVAEALKVPYYVTDFAKLDEVRQLASDIKRAYPRIDVLINNAGGIFGDRELTVDGFEKTLQVNYLAPYLLTNLLMDTLIKSKAKVLNTSSIANKVFSDLDINDLNMANNYTMHKAYGNSKLENILFTKELNIRYGSAGLAAVCFHPGNIATNFASSSKGFIKFLYHGPFKKLFGLITPEKGADNMIWLATSEPGKDWTPGEYYIKHKIGKAIDKAYDTELARKLWNQSATMVGI